MKRRNALKLLGSLIVCLGGTAQAVEKDALKITTGDLDWWVPKPINYTFHAPGINNIIIERIDKPDIIVPFSEIIDALDDK